MLKIIAQVLLMLVLFQLAIRLGAGLLAFLAVFGVLKMLWNTN